MSKRIKNIDNEYVDLEVIRYFINNDVEYLIYSLNEIDEAGYTKYKKELHVFVKDTD